MPTRLFDVDQTDLIKLTKFYATAPRKFAKATGQMLNDFAFGTRHTAIEVIREKMTVRDPRFVERRLQVDKTHGRLPIQSQGAEVGSTFFKRFTGWREQQLGTKTPRDRVISILARGGSKTRKAAPAARMKPGVSFEHAGKYPGRNVEQRTIVMLQALRDFRYKKPFIIRRKKGMRPGLYKFVRKEPRLLQTFKPGKAQPKRIPWLEMAEDRYFRRENIGRLWARTIDRILRR